MLGGSAVPAIAARLPGTREGIEPPDCLAIFRIDGEDEAATVIGVAAARPDHDLAMNDQGAAVDAKMVGHRQRIEYGLIPQNVTVADIKCDQMAVRGRYEQPVLVDRERLDDVRASAL